jgi:hypothetical protein
MALRRRRTRLPDDVRASLDLPRGDRVLATAELADGWAVATVGALHVAKGGGVEHHAWVQVDGARLDPESAEVTLSWVDGAPPLVLSLVDARSHALPGAVHDRVQSSVVHSEKVTLPSGAVVRVALRRGADGDLLTQVIGTGDVDLANPVTARAVAAAEARVREAAGLR